MTRRVPFLPLMLSLVAACAPQQYPATPRPAPRPIARPPVAATPLPKPVKPAKPARPAWSARTVVTDASDVAATTIVVVAGDSLSAIARRTGTGIGAIAVANQLPQPFVIMPGQTLKIPAGRYHRVKEGETGIAIARAYGIDWDEVIAANGLAQPYVLRVGERLRLPSKAAVAAMTLEQRAAAFRIDIDDLISGGEPASTSTARPNAPARPSKPVAEPTRFAGRFTWPIDGRILSSFGGKGSGRYNDGINIRAQQGAPFRAAADGVVAYAGDAIEGFGNLLLIKHGDGWVTAYAHAEALLVKRGASVRQGEIIGRAGRSGSVDEPQLHFEIRRGRTPVDPLGQLPARGRS